VGTVEPAEASGPNGDEFWVTGTDEGTATFTPDNPAGVSASGHFASWFGESSNNKNACSATPTTSTSLAVMAHTSSCMRQIA
jgi:hypothetical protein